MKNKNELNYKDLKLTCDQSLFNFENTSEVENITTGIGQERGIKALEFGLQVNVKGYNIYLEGPSGVGKTMYTKNYLNKISKKQKTPCDWCYIYNFDNPNEPIAVSLPAGQGKEFKEAMDGFILEIKKDSYIKRVIGLPGEHVQIKDGKVYINGEELQEDYLQSGIVTDVLGVGFDDFVVPENCVFAMGDNRSHSTDCRSFGCIPLKKIESKVWIRIWPLNLFGKVK